MQQLGLKIRSNYFKFAATLFNLQELYFICSNFILFAAINVFNLQHVPCGPAHHVELGQLTYPLTSRKNVVL